MKSKKQKTLKKRKSKNIKKRGGAAAVEVAPQNIWGELVENQAKFIRILRRLLKNYGIDESKETDIIIKDILDSISIPELDNFFKLLKQYKPSEEKTPLLDFLFSQNLIKQLQKLIPYKLIPDLEIAKEMQSNYLINFKYYKYYIDNVYKLALLLTPKLIQEYEDNKFYNTSKGTPFNVEDLLELFQKHKLPIRHILTFPNTNFKSNPKLMGAPYNNNEIPKNPHASNFREEL